MVGVVLGGMVAPGLPRALDPHGDGGSNGSGGDGCGEGEARNCCGRGDEDDRL